MTVTNKSPHTQPQTITTPSVEAAAAAPPAPQQAETPRPPRTIDEYLLGQLEIDSGCATEAVIPPPDACPGYVQTAGSLASMHFVTLVVVFGFMVILLQMTMVIFKDK